MTDTKGSDLLSDSIAGASDSLASETAEKKTSPKKTTKSASATQSSTTKKTTTPKKTTTKTTAGKTAATGAKDSLAKAEKEVTPPADEKDSTVKKTVSKSAARSPRKATESTLADGAEKDASTAKKSTTKKTTSASKKTAASSAKPKGSTAVSQKTSPAKETPVKKSSASKKAADAADAVETSPDEVAGSAKQASTATEKQETSAKTAKATTASKTTTKTARKTSTQSTSPKKPVAKKASAKAKAEEASLQEPPQDKADTARSGENMGKTAETKVDKQDMGVLEGSRALSLTGSTAKGLPAGEAYAALSGEELKALQEDRKTALTGSRSKALGGSIAKNLQGTTTALPAGEDTEEGKTPSKKKSAAVGKSSTRKTATKTTQAKSKASKDSPVQEKTELDAMSAEGAVDAPSAAAGGGAEAMPEVGAATALNNIQKSPAGKEGDKGSNEPETALDQESKDPGQEKSGAEGAETVRPSAGSEADGADAQSGGEEKKPAAKSRASKPATKKSSAPKNAGKKADTAATKASDETPGKTSDKAAGKTAGRASGKGEDETLADSEQKAGKDDKGQQGKAAQGKASQSKVGQTKTQPASRTARRKMFVSVMPEEQVEVVITEEGQVQEYYVEMLQQQKTKGNIYKATIHNVDANLQAAFVNYGANKNGFLQIDEVHPEYYNVPHDENSNRRYPPIQKVLKPGQELLVQVVKEPNASKGAFLTTYLSLAGRFLVLTPGREQIGVSRKVDDGSERDRLREMLEGFKPGPGLGVIVRTVSVGMNKATLKKDLQSLKTTWEKVRKLGVEEKAPTLIYEEIGLATRCVRDYLTDQIAEVWLDDPETAKDVEELASTLFPKKSKLVHVHTDFTTSLFERFNVQRQLDQIQSREVPLPSGGRLVIDTTEALTAIDINSGRSGGKNSFEDMAFRTNMEAAKMIPLQLRLRDIGGQVVCDFIEMRDKAHWREVEKTVRAAMKVDRARHDVGRISSFGLLELVRQRLGSSAISVNMEVCPHCKGSGVRRNLEWQSQQALKEIARKMRAAKEQKQTSITYGVDALVAMYLLNNKRQRLNTLEEQLGITVEINLGEQE